MKKEIGSYEVLDLIGDGGMGAVYRGRDPRFDREVAIKVLHPQFQRDPGVVERFKSEAVIQAKLNHPNIVTVFDFIAEPGMLAIVMEYVEGFPLDQVIARAGGPLPVERTVRLMEQVLSAIALAHSRGLVHRDIKPSNILVQALEGQEYAKVADFGIAKILGSEKLRTATGAKMGTLAYMSPEHVRSPKSVDARSDIYALGVVLYEMLTGRMPFDADSEYELMRQIVEAPMRPPELLSATAASLAPVVERSMAKDPAARFATCSEMRELLAAAGQGRPHPGETRAKAAVIGTNTSAAVVGSGTTATDRAEGTGARRVAGGTRAPALAQGLAASARGPEPRRRWVGIAAALAVVASVAGGFAVVSAREEAEKRRQQTEAARFAAEQERARAAEVDRRLLAEKERLRAAEVQRAAEAERRAEEQRRLEAQRLEAEARRIAAEQETQRQREAAEAARAEAARVEAARVEAARAAAAAAQQARIAALSVPGGPPLVLRMRQGLSSASARRGTQIEATLLQELSSEGHTIIPAGARVVGEVVSATSGASGEVPALVVSFNRIIVESEGSVSITTNNHEVSGTQRTGSDRVANAIAGALLGGLLGGKKGAAQGAAAGASTDSFEKARPALIEANQRVEVRLLTPVRRPSRPGVPPLKP